MNDERGQTPSPRTLRQDIARYIRDAGGFQMPDLRASAQACQRRIEALGYEWNDQRLLWRAPDPPLSQSFPRKLESKGQKKSAQTPK